MFVWPVANSRMRFAAFGVDVKIVTGCSSWAGERMASVFMALLLAKLWFQAIDDP